MLRIGIFARLGQVTVATLRHYDDVGLLAPIRVDPESGYRYYSAGQLPRLHRILSLKDLGFSLGHIRQALDDDISAEQLRGMLRLKRAEVEQRLSDDQARLSRIEARLRQIEQEHTMSNQEVVLKTVAPVLVASRRIRIPTNDQVPDHLGPAFAEATQHAQAHGAHPNGACLALWYTSADTLSDEEAEAAVPLDRPVPASERVQVYELPQVQVAAWVHDGDFNDFTQGHAILLDWIEANGHRPAGPFREIYIRNDAEGSTTEIQYPVERA